tara:strand:+ start:144 stop:962 length:819 start_codon:yes stop_codon:yes gene_type:complete
MARGKKVSPAKFIGAITGVVGGVSNLIGGSRALGSARDQQKKAQAELEKQKAAYTGLDTSNIYADVESQIATENPYEDLTVNQQQAQFQAQQGMQQRANIMQNLRGAAGGSGVAALAQQMAAQGQLATQKASASIGQQEAANQRLMAQGASKIQDRQFQATQLKLRGAEAARGLEYDKQAGLMGLASGQLQAANKSVADAKAQKAAGISGIIGGAVSGIAGGLGGGLLDKAKGLVSGGGGVLSGAANTFGGSNPLNIDKTSSLFKTFTPTKL